MTQNAVIIGRLSHVKHSATWSRTCLLEESFVIPGWVEVQCSVSVWKNMQEIKEWEEICWPVTCPSPFWLLFCSSPLSLPPIRTILEGYVIIEWPLLSPTACLWWISKTCPSPWSWRLQCQGPPARTWLSGFAGSVPSDKLSTCSLVQE